MNRLLSALLIPLTAGWLTVCNDDPSLPDDSDIVAGARVQDLDALLRNNASAIIDELGVSDPSADRLVRFVHQQLAAGQTGTLHAALEDLHFGTLDTANRWRDEPENAEDLGYLVSSIMVALADPEWHRSRKIDLLKGLLGVPSDRTASGIDTSDSLDTSDSNSHAYLKTTLSDLEAGRSQAYIAAYELAVFEMSDEAHGRFDEVMIRVTGLQAYAH